MTFSTEHITDDFMRERLAQSKAYTVMLLKQGPKWDTPDRDATIWERIPPSSEPMVLMRQ